MRGQFKVGHVPRRLLATRRLHSKSKQCSIQLPPPTLATLSACVGSTRGNLSLMLICCPFSQIGQQRSLFEQGSGSENRHRWGHAVKGKWSATVSPCVLWNTSDYTGWSDQDTLLGEDQSRCRDHLVLLLDCSGPRGSGKVRCSSWSLWEHRLFDSPLPLRTSEQSGHNDYQSVWSKGRRQ